MVVLAVVVLFSWGALSGGFGAYALTATFQSESLYHAVQAGISLLIATVSVSAGFLALIVGGVKADGLAARGQSGAAASDASAGAVASQPARSVEDPHGSRD